MRKKAPSVEIAQNRPALSQTPCQQTSIRANCWPDTDPLDLSRQGSLGPDFGPASPGRTSIRARWTHLRRDCHISIESALAGVVRWTRRIMPADYHPQSDPPTKVGFCSNTPDLIRFVTVFIPGRSCPQIWLLPAAFYHLELFSRT